MAQIDFTVDTTELLKLNRYFSQQDWMKVKRRALTKAGNIIRKEAKNTFKAKLPAAGRKSRWYNDKLIDAVRFSKMQTNGLGELSLVVHTMGSNKKGSGTFRARFFEKGTQDRYTKRPYIDSLGRRYPAGQYRGKIEPPLHYFHDATSNYNYAENNMMRLLEQEIIKLNNKKF